jgi:hypothetical protein
MNVQAEDWKVYTEYRFERLLQLVSGQPRRRHVTVPTLSGIVMLDTNANAPKFSIQHFFYLLHSY